MSQELVRETKGGIATITINRPEQRNAMTYDMWQRLARYMAELDPDPEVRWRKNITPRSMMPWNPSPISPNRRSPWLPGFVWGAGSRS